MRLIPSALLAAALLGAGNKPAQAVLINWPAGLSAGTIPVLVGTYNANYVFAGITGLATIYLYNSGGYYDIYDWDDSFGAWDPSEPTFYPGQGYFVYTLQAQTFNPLFSFGAEGVVADQGPPPLSENTYAFQGSPTGLSATYEDIFGGAPTNETTLMRFIPGSSDFSFGSAQLKSMRAILALQRPPQPPRSSGTSARAAATTNAPTDQLFLIDRSLPGCETGLAPPSDAAPITSEVGATRNEFPGAPPGNLRRVMEGLLGAIRGADPSDSRAHALCSAPSSRARVQRNSAAIAATSAESPSGPSGSTGNV
jgi:hypothetical protein